MNFNIQKVTFVLAVTCFILLALTTGTTTYTATQSFAQKNRMCKLLTIASDEADMAPAWHIRTGEALEKCGIPNAHAVGNYRGCLAERRNDIRINCDKLEELAFPSK